MDYLWTPWRYNYISTVDAAEGCPFCLEDSVSNDEERFVIFRGVQNFVILNIYPYTSGHILISPYQHISNFSDCTPEMIGEMMLLAQQCKLALESCYKPYGFNLGMNLGRCAGAGVDQHLHLHVVPRWQGDSNFMTITGETRILPESLETTYQKLTRHFRESRQNPNA